MHCDRTGLQIVLQARASALHMFEAADYCPWTCRCACKLIRLYLVVFHLFLATEYARQPDAQGVVM